LPSLSESSFDTAFATDIAHTHAQPRHASDSALSGDSASAARGAVSANDHAVSTDHATGIVPFRHASDTAYTNDRGSGGPPTQSTTDYAPAFDTASVSQPVVHVVTLPLVRVVARFSCFTRLPTPVPTSTSGQVNHDYEVIVCDKYGLAAGQIVSAVPQEIDFVLNAIGEAQIDFWIFDPSASVLDIHQMPGGQEVQIWRDQVLIFWGVPVSLTFDASQVHLTCQDLLWYFSTRNFGPNPFNLLVNPGFENGVDGGGIPLGWEFIIDPLVPLSECIVRAPASGWPVLEGTYSVQLNTTYPHAVADTYLRQYVPFNNSSPYSITYDLSAWVCNLFGIGVASPDAFPVAVNSNGLFMQAIVEETIISGSPQVQSLDGSTALGWNRFDVQVVVPPSSSGVLEIRLYAPGIAVFWDACVLTTNLSVGLSQDLGPVSLTVQADVRDIMTNIVNYAQDPTWGKSDLVIGLVGPDTGRLLTRLYALSDNGGILDALNEFPSIGVCDFAIQWDSTGHHRWFEIFAPAMGAIKYNYPLELDVGVVTDLQGAVDGSQSGTAQRVLGQGASGSSDDIGYAAFPSYLGGRVSAGNGQVTMGSTTVTTSAPFFLPTDVGHPIYSLAQALPIATLVAEYISSTEVTVLTPNSQNPSQGANQTVTNDTVGIDGCIIDAVASAIQDLPITTLQGTAQQSLMRQLAAQVIPAARFLRDTPNKTFDNIDLGDVVPVLFNYGWLQLPGPLMRIVGLTLYPVTEEISPTLNVVNGVP
jgi:hypothetical protein